jgi:hypothetical protein
MNIIYSILDGRNFKPYLLSMDSKYGLLLPTNNALLTFIDPSTYGRSRTGEDGVKVEIPEVIELTYDKTRKSIKATRYNATVDEFGEITKGEVKSTSVNGAVLNKLYDMMMDQMIIVIPNKSKTVEDYVRDGYHFFRTKGGSLIRATYQGNDLMFQGGWQIEHDQYIPAIHSYVKDNGKSYELEKMAPMGAQNSVYVTLQQHPEFKSFLTIMENDYNNVLKEKLSNKYNPGLQAIANKNLGLLDNYNYTVYVPTNESIQQLQEEGYLPTDAELDKGDNDAVLDSICIAEGWYGEKKLSANDSATVRKNVAAAITTIMSNFVRYHVQDHSVAIGMTPDVDDNGAEKLSNKYESMMRNTETGRFFPIGVDYDNSKMTVTDVIGNARKVKTEDGLYNLICREYWFEGTGDNSRLFMASDVVVHQIDGVLFNGYTYPEDYSDPSLAGKTVKMRPWREVVREALNM